MISVLILTYNEEIDIGACLDSVSWADDILILDSLSTDRTLAIAHERGARVVQRPFSGYASQRNFGLQQDFRHDWILMIDADERVTPELRGEIQQVIQLKDNPVTLYRARRRDYFLNQWIRRSSGYPTWFGRLFRRGRVRVEREINEEYHTDGTSGFLENHLDHYPFNKGIHHWYERHNRYSSMEASVLTTELGERIPWDLLTSEDPAERRKALKAIAYRLPLRPLLAFIYLYLLRGGFLDGLPGFHFSLLRASYEYMISLKLREIRRHQENPVAACPWPEC